MSFDLAEFAEAVDNALAEGAPCVLATVDGGCRPNLGLKGSMLVLDKHRLAYWERTGRRHLSNLRASGNVAVLYYNRERGLHLRFYGRATLHESGAEREQVMARVVDAEMERDAERAGVAVIIDVDSVFHSKKGLLQRDGAEAPSQD